MQYINEDNGYIIVLCEKCGQLIKKSKCYCTTIGNEYFFNPEITCKCGNTQDSAYKYEDDLAILQIDITGEIYVDEIKETNEINWIWYRDPEDIKKSIEIMTEVMLPKPIKAVFKAGEVIENATKEVIKKSPGYKMGKYEGKKEGATEVSKEYEEKLIKQAMDFERQKVLARENEEEYKILLDKYEIYIREQEAKFKQLSQEQKKRFEEMKDHYERLLKVK